MKLRIFVAFVLALFVLNASSIEGLSQTENKKSTYSIAAKEATSSVSLVALIANPGKYLGKRIRVSGYLHNKFEDKTLYLSKDDADYGIYSNSIGVEFSSDIRTEPKGFPMEQYDGSYVLLEGLLQTMGKSDEENMLILVNVNRIRRHDQSYNGVRATKSGTYDGYVGK